VALRRRYVARRAAPAPGAAARRRLSRKKAPSLFRLPVSHATRGTSGQFVCQLSEETSCLRLTWIGTLSRILQPAIMDSHLNCFHLKYADKVNAFHGYFSLSIFDFKKNSKTDFFSFFVGASTIKLLIAYPELAEKLSTDRWVQLGKHR